MYYGMEAKYYAVLDAIDKAGIPIYKLVNPIDKVIPSFAIVLIVLGLVLIYLIFLIATSLGVNAPNTPVTVYFIDEGANPAVNLLLTVSLPDGNSFNMKTDELGSISFLASPDDVLTFGIPLASGETVTKTLIIGDALEYKIALDAYSVQDTINFSVNSLDGLVLKEINLDFYCSNPNASVPESVYGSIENEYSVLVDPDCGKLLVDVKSSNYNEEFGIEIFEGSSINLQPVTGYAGDFAIVLSVYDAAGLPVNGYSATLSQGGIPVQVQDALNTSVTTFGGLASATYLLSITMQGYLPKTQTIILTPDNKTLPLTLTLEKDLKGVAGSLLVSVVEAGTTKKQKNASVSVYSLNADGTQNVLIAGDKMTNEDGLASVPVGDISAKYWVVVSKDGYKTKNVKEVPVLAEPYLIALALKGTERMLVVKVLDDENKAVSNAVVAFYDDEGNVVEPKFGVTDINGFAMNVVETGSYVAYVYKGQFSGFGELFAFDDSTELPVIGYDNLVHIVLPKAVWEINLVDQFGQPVQNALVNLYDAYAPEPFVVGAKFASPQGLFSADNLRADKKYYAVVSSPSFENYVSVSKFLSPNAKTTETFVMEKQKLAKKPTITFLGIEDSEGKSALKLGQGNLYKAKFKITLPYNKDYKKLYATFLAGDLDIVEKENFYIDKANASGYATVIKGRAYVENNVDLSIGDVTQTNEEFLEGSPFEDQTKWVQLYWNMPKNYFDNGVLFVDVYLKVKEGTLDGTQLPFSYNINAENIETENDEEETLFDPLDEHPDEFVLFNAKKKSYFSVGDGQQICDDKFCIELSILDINEDIKTSVSGDVPYISTLGKDYDLKFTFMNNNPVPLTNYRVVLEMPQENICMNMGAVSAADNSATIFFPEKTKFDDCFKYIYKSSTTPLVQNGLIKGDLIFTPIKEGTGSFKLTVIEDKSPIYVNEFYIDVFANKDMNVLVEPEIIPAYVNQELKFTATDSATGAFLNNANVKVVDVYDTVLVEGETDGKGESILTLPKQLPNIDLDLKVTKENYKAFEKNLKTDAKFIKIEPEELKVSVVVSEKFGKSSLKLTNISELPVEIVDVELLGNFDEYVDVQSVNEYLKTTNVGKLIDKEHSYTLPISVSLTNLADALQSNREYTAELKIFVGPKGYGTVDSKWDYTVPVTLQITLGKGLDNLDCLGVDTTKSEFISTSGKNDQDEVTIVNGCTVNSKPVPLYNLEAKVNWKGNGLGLFVFNKDSLTSKLQSAYYVTLANKMVPHDEQMFVVDFMPINGKVSGSGSAEVNVRAGFFTEAGVQFVEKKLEYPVSVLDLTSCISYTLPEAEVDLVKVPRDAKGSFSIKNDCEAPIDLKLKILPDQFIDVKPLDFTVPAKGEKQIVIDPKNSPIGVYLLDVYGKTPKAHYEAVHAGPKGLRIFIAPLLEDCVVLDNYEFNLTDTEAKDANRYTYAINKCYYKDVKAVYDLKVIAGGFGWFFGNEDADSGTCASENWQGMLGSALPAAIAGGFSGKTIGDTFYGKDGIFGQNQKWGLASDSPEEIAQKKVTTQNNLDSSGAAVVAAIGTTGLTQAQQDKLKLADNELKVAEEMQKQGNYDKAQEHIDKANALTKEATTTPAPAMGGGTSGSATGSGSSGSGSGSENTVDKAQADLTVAEQNLQKAKDAVDAAKNTQGNTQDDAKALADKKAAEEEVDAKQKALDDAKKASSTSTITPPPATGAPAAAPAAAVEEKVTPTITRVGNNITLSWPNFKESKDTSYIISICFKETVVSCTEEANLGLLGLDTSHTFFLSSSQNEKFYMVKAYPSNKVSNWVAVPPSDGGPVTGTKPPIGTDVAGWHSANLTWPTKYDNEISKIINAINFTKGEIPKTGTNLTDALKIQEQEVLNLAWDILYNSVIGLSANPEDPQGINGLEVAKANVNSVIGDINPYITPTIPELS